MPQPIAAVLLAAGRSSRFGGDKLAADCGGMAVLTRAAQALRAAAPGPRLAVLRHPAHAALLPEGFETAFCEGQQSDSLHRALDWAQSLRAPSPVPGLLIALADMPFVSPDLHHAVMARMTDLPACALGETPSPPAAFSAAWFPRLRALIGDRGAGALLTELPAAQYVPATMQELRDIDLPTDLP
ncbi:NTP transferase domain-containing protein [Paracoccus xiamenensis]|uniref:NTP transferase domain-containing protein n=1 Tax=Paracoccus xiamenensis TaxID=2714901 RepID=UPI00140A3A7C|nr:NTP transferase domain-containing protein [Paracoccus xiamenensis]NHF71885.1 NTP transferase domain-containing protein [Paracoccus xiamenensis]